MFVQGSQRMFSSKNKNKNLFRTLLVTASTQTTLKPKYPRVLDLHYFILFKKPKTSLQNNTFIHTRTVVVLYLHRMLQQHLE